MRSLLLISLSLLGLTACVTTQESKSSAQRASSSPASSSGLIYQKTPIVQQTSGRSILRKLDRDTWIQLRNSTKDAHIKLYATLGAGEWDVAISDARAYLQAHPRDEVAITVLSLALSMKKNYSLAAYYAKLLEEMHPGNPEVYNILGLAIMNKPGPNYEDYRDAMRNFQTAFDASSQQVASGLNLAYLQLEMGNASVARDTFAAVRERCEQCVEASLGHGIALSRTREFEKAEKAFQSVLEKDPHSSYARYYLALVAKYGRNDNQAAMKYLSAILDDTQNKNTDMQRKANFLYRRIQAQVYGQPKEAIVEAKPQPSKKNTAKKAEAAQELPPAQPVGDIEQAIEAGE